MREVRKWEIRVGFPEEETYKQRPGAADGGSLEDPGEELSRQREAVWLEQSDRGEHARSWDQRGKGRMWGLRAVPLWGLGFCCG